MRIRCLIGAVAIAALMPFAANAVTLSGNVSPGGTYDVLGDCPCDFNAMFVGSDAAGAFDFTFTNNLSSVAAVTISQETVNQLGSLFFNGNVLSEWLFGGASHVTPTGVGETFQLTTTIAPGAFDILRITFSDPQGTANAGPDIDFLLEATPIPLPASVLMLLASLAGLGIVSRRRKFAV